MRKLTLKEQAIVRETIYAEIQKNLGGEMITEGLLLNLEQVDAVVRVIVKKERVDVELERGVIADKKKVKEEKEKAKQKKIAKDKERREKEAKAKVEEK